MRKLSSVYVLAVIALLGAVSIRAQTGDISLSPEGPATSQSDTPAPDGQDGTGAGTASDELQECIALDDIRQYSKYHLNQLGYELELDGYYFCSDTAPKRYQCKCSTSSVCHKKYDPFGRDLGECGCCQTWIWAVLLFLLVAIFIGLLFCLYACLCRGRWWCDGHPRTVQPILPRRGPPTVLPSSVPVPTTMFRNYRPVDFESGLPPGVSQDRTRARSSGGNQGANPRRGGSAGGSRAAAAGGSSGRGGRTRTTAQGGGTREEMSPLTSGSQEVASPTTTNNNAASRGAASPTVASPVNASGPRRQQSNPRLSANRARSRIMSDTEMEVRSATGSFSDSGGVHAQAIESAGAVPSPPTAADTQEEA